jgi:hypothetical protein
LLRQEGNKLLVGEDRDGSEKVEGVIHELSIGGEAHP